MLNRCFLILLHSFLFLLPSSSTSQTGAGFGDSTIAGISFRSLGPAFMSGRIADIAIDPQDESRWFVAVGSGGVWRTTNAGTTWDPVFDSQPVYSIGCVTIDPHNRNRIWVGTGENVGGRHVGYGDGIYRSDDGGASWKNLGLKETQHISRVIVHPENSDVVWVAAQGPLWNKGGERGVYRTTDGGMSWTRTLGDDEWTGATDIVIDPRNPDLLYAATWQRHRNVAAYMGGGPGSGIHRSADGGETWVQLKKGLPTSNLGKIGLAVSPQNPDVVYAAIELDRRTGGVYRSEDRGSSWNKMSDAVAGATGPHYYQELYASPHQFDKLYLVDVRMQVSENGGKTFRRMNEQNKHVDNHAIAWRMSDPDYILVGTDGGLYESFDGEKSWKFVANLPVTQYYKVAVDDREPFYYLYGGTQDNNTHGGPSQTDNLQGIRNADWFTTLFGDGHQPATEPGNPNIVYSQWQQGNLVRTDRATGEIVYIKPQPEPGGGVERFNWDAPILVSPHNPARLYFGSQRVWKSENRGDSWEPVSGDLTRDQERIALPIMGAVQSFDNPWDISAMSTYNTVTSLTESPLREGLLYAGTDDGLIHVTEDGGKSWSRIEAGSLPGVPATAFVNDIKADLFHPDRVYVALDNHKFGDLNPYLLMSDNRGRSWKKLSETLPERTLVWRIVQDHRKPELFFLATEFGIYVTLDAGKKWTKMNGGLPTISFRDLAIQRRESDLVGASFGRGFYVLDDYSFLRMVSDSVIAREGALFAPEKTSWYIERPHLGFSEKATQGDAYYVAPNPPFGATFTYYLRETIQSKKEIRQQREKDLLKKKEPVTFPGWDALDEEAMEQPSAVWLTVRDVSGNIVRRLSGATTRGFHRATWDLRYPPVDPVRLNPVPVEDPDDAPQGRMAGPGMYSVTLSKEVGGVITHLAPPAQFEVVPLREGTLPGASPDVVAAFWADLDIFKVKSSALSLELGNGLKRVKAMRSALHASGADPGELDALLHRLQRDIMMLEDELNGSRSKRQVGEDTRPTIDDRFGAASIGTMFSTYGPTPMHRRSLEIAQEEFTVAAARAGEILKNRIPALERELQAAGAPWIEGQSLPLPR